MSEASMWRKLRETVFSGPGVHAERIENRLGKGTPDVNYCFLMSETRDPEHAFRGEGWIELKEIKGWPARPDTVVRVEHYTKEQRDWALRRTAAGGTVWLLLKVGRSDWLLFTGAHAAGVVGKVCKRELMAAATVVWTTAPGRRLLQEISE